MSFNKEQAAYLIHSSIKSYVAKFTVKELVHELIELDRTLAIKLYCELEQLDKSEG